MSVEVMKQALGDICGAKLCEINSMSSRVEMLRLMDSAIATLRQAIKDEEERFKPDYDTNAVLLERIRELEAQLEWDTSDMAHRSGGLSVEQEPVGEVLNIQWMSNTGGWLIGFHSKQRLYKGDKLYVKPMLIKPENIDTKVERVDGMNIEPVAWQVMVEDEPMKEFSIKEAAHDWAVTEKRNGSSYSYWIRPLYTAPPKREWQSLTDNEIIWIENSTPSRSYNDHARAIEAKLKELNHD